MGAGVWEFVGRGTKSFAHGIPPDIAVNILSYVIWPENMVVIAHFPKTVTFRFPKLEGRSQLEDAHQFEQVS